MIDWRWNITYCLGLMFGFLFLSHWWEALIIFVMVCLFDVVFHWWRFR